jgi:Ser/Thr protein kinase RdoA (MazF antagonist)
MRFFGRVIEAFTMLPLSFTSPAAYAERFTDATFWRPYIEAICARHALTHSGRIRAGLPGTNVVFIVDDRYAIKLFTPLFGGAASFPAELELYELLAHAPDFPAPALLAHGALFPHDQRWPWPYIVTQVVPGTSFGEVRRQVSPADTFAVVAALGPLLRRMHRLDPAGARHLRAGWDAFVRFMAEQRSSCVANHRHWQTTPDHLIGQIDAYLPPIEALVEQTTRPQLLHGDLNEDHVLGRFAAGHWRITGIIDFGDARFGDRLYDLAPLHIGLFRCDKRLLRCFLEGYGFDDRPRFVQQVMSYTLLHECDVLGPIFGWFPAARAITRLDELATLLWDLDRPGLDSYP